jgi:carboxyl-terminal processing protease
MSLGDGSAIRLTVSRYYTPTGRSIQKPYSKDGGEEYYTNDGFEGRLFSGELSSADSIKVDDSLKFVTPKGKTVYGGGGIIPDVFVGIDTTAFFGTFHVRVMNDFVFNYVDSHRKELEEMTLTEFLESFDKDEKILNEYLAIIKKNIKGEIDNISYIKLYLKSLFARFLYGDNTFYMVLNQNDKMLEKVKELEYKIDYVKH